MRKILVLVGLLLVSIGASAQIEQLMGPIPADTAVRMGRLENGMSYYIRHNEKPKGQADFYILHNVGAIQENDAQQGLAHFLEHMAFNGTKNLPDKQLTEYLEKVGVKFGTNLNASTSWDQTTYLIRDVPTSRDGIIDSALLVLHDWSHFITLDPAEIDSERGVIMEELRTRDGAGWRSSIEFIKTIGKGTKYEHRNLIGYLDGLKNFPHDALVDFYHQWYRPDYQAVVVVGDVDVDAVEAKIQKLMSDIPAPADDASQKETYVVPDNEEPLVSIFTDKEMQSTVAKLYIKHRAMPKEQNNTGMRNMLGVLYSYLGTMQNNRLGEMAMKPDAQFLGASMGVGGVGMIPTLECAVFAVQTQDGKLLEGFEALCVEMERMRRYGFTQSEFERAQENMLRSCERSYLSRNDRTNNGFVQTYLSNYQHNTAMPDAKTRWKIDSTMVMMANVRMVNDLAAKLITPNNRVLAVTAPRKEGVSTPTAEELVGVMTKVAGMDIAAHEDTLVREPLISEGTVFKGSPVKKTALDERYGTTEWTLRNGVRIVVKPTKFKADEIRMSASSYGGTSLFPDEDYYSSQLLGSLLGFSGLSKFSAVELQKQLTGKVAAASVSIGEYSNGVGAACSPQDLETMLQLVYLTFTQPRFNEDDYNTMMKMVMSQLENAKADPSYAMQERFDSLMYQKHFRRQMITPELLQNADFSKFPAMYERLFPGVKGFTFIFVGNIDLDELKPLVEKYVGSIPVQKKALEYVDDKARSVKGEHTEDFRTPMQQPKVSVSYVYTGDIPYSVENKMTMTFLTQALDSRYQISVREEKGGSYGVSVSGSISNIPNEAYSLLVRFDTNEQMADELRAIIVKELETIAANGPEAENIEKTREYLSKSWKNSLDKNGSWMSYISTHISKRYPFDYLADYERILAAVTGERVQELARKILSDGNLVKMIMRPEVAPVATEGAAVEE